MFVLSCCGDKRALYVFSANIWFDLRVSGLLKALVDSDFKIKMCYSGGKCFLMKMTREKQTIRFINIQNIFPVSVKKIGDIIGMEKLHVDFDKVTDEDLLTYCRRDTEIIVNAVLYWLKFIKDHDLGSFGPTLASQAFNAYRHKYMSSPIMIHDRRDVLEHERAGYFGGRTECFFVGEIKGRTMYVLDINSQYPYVMRENNFPYALRYTSTDTTPEQLYNLSDNYCVVGRCRLDTNEPVYARRYDNKTVFPVGRFETTLCTASFRYAYEHEHVVSVSKASIYRGAKIFEKWVIDLYTLRQKYMKEGKHTMTYLVKLLLNSLYGKFGQKTDDVIEEKFGLPEEYFTELYYDQTKAQWYTIVRIGNYQKVMRTKTEEAFHSFPTISAHVTDYARLYLWKLINVAGRDNVYYVDTDSLYVNYSGYRKLRPFINDMELGMLKLEAKSTYFKIYAPKDYIFGDFTKLKGIPKSAIPIDDNTFDCVMFPGMKRDLQKGMLDDYVIERRIKHLQRKYDKGTVTSSGRVEPFQVAEF